MLSLKKTLTASVCCTFLAGCAVTPKPIDPAQRSLKAKADTELIFASQEPLGESLSLTEAMARALKYNLDNRVQLMEQALSHQNFELVKMDMLPVLSASGGYNHRNNINGSSSYSIKSGRESLEPSTSQESERTSADLKFSWNALDFGVSYLQAQQEADRFLIAKNTRRKVMLRLLQQTRAIYWRASAMQQLGNDIDVLLSLAQKASERLQVIRKQQLQPPLSTLQEQRLLLETVQELESMKQSVNAAQVELATMINVPPGTRIKLQFPRKLNGLPSVPANLEVLEYLALENSMDYSTQMYNARIDQLETRKALLRLLPGIEFSYAGMYDSNKYLYNQGWAEAGVRISWDIFRLFSKDEIEAQGEARQQLTETRRMAVQMGIIAQTHLAWQHYKNSATRYGRASEVHGIDEEIARLTRQGRQNRAVSELDEIQNDAKALRSAMARLLSYAEAQDAYGSLLFSLSLNPVPEDYQLQSVAQISQHLTETFGSWESGEMPALAMTVSASN
ncbi:TolC family protein [Spongorhabdus nitratireducens]